MAAVAFQKGLGAVHGLSEPIGAVHNTQHGLTNAVLLPYILRANRKAVEPKFEHVSRHLGLSGAAGNGFDETLRWVEELAASLQIPTTLRAIGVDESTAVELGIKAEANPTGHTNPIRYTAAEYEAIFRRAVDGQ